MCKYLLESLPRERSECIGHHRRVFDTAVRRLGKSLPCERGPAQAKRVLWLEQSFKIRFEVTPKAYVKCLRLARLRRDLQYPPCGELQTIIELASVYGFWHMGQLAADYRKVYGELPSDTMMQR